MLDAATAPTDVVVHETLSSGVEFAADALPSRQTVSIVFRVLAGASDDPADLTGLGSIVERTLNKGTKKYSGQELADAFDKIGAQLSSACGRQSTVVRVSCLPEFTLDVVDLVGEMLASPTFPDDACGVATQLAAEELKHMDDDPQSLLMVAMQRLALGPVYGRHPGGEVDSLPRIKPKHVREFWANYFHAGRVQVVAAGPVNVDALCARVDKQFKGLGSATAAGRGGVDYRIAVERKHINKDLKQQYIGISLQGAAKGSPGFAAEQVAVAVLSGGMSARLFTEVREKQGLVYWVGAWAEQPRGMGLIHLGASTTPERCEKTYQTLLRELARLSEDLTEEEVKRARDG
ncbi:MAG: M16 family metallopeptidase, partial [Phycisphaerae bacterium]